MPSCQKRVDGPLGGDRKPAAPFTKAPGQPVDEECIAEEVHLLPEATNAMGSSEEQGHDVRVCAARDVSRIGPATDCDILRNVGLR